MPFRRNTLIYLEFAILTAPKLKLENPELQLTALIVRRVLEGSATHDQRKLAKLNATLRPGTRHLYIPAEQEPVSLSEYSGQMIDTPVIAHSDQP